jgi:hypothetical protein
VTRQGLAEGRVMLRILEHGDGPSISIAWPNDPGARTALYDRLTRCHGMQVGLMTNDGALYRMAEPSGTPWNLNKDHFSDFVREPKGRIIPAEQHALHRIRVHHRLPTGFGMVRLFPRDVDAALLHGLHVLAGESRRIVGNIEVRYLFAGNKVQFGYISLDGHPVRGKIELPKVEPHC